MISEILPEEKRRLNELELDFAELERGNPRANAVDVKMGLDEMCSRLLELERLVNNEPKGRREEFKRRVQHLRTSHGHLHNSFESFTRRTGVQDLRSNLFSGAVRPDDHDNINYDLRNGRKREFGSIEYHVEKLY